MRNDENWLRRACTVTNSPTRSTRVSSFSEATVTLPQDILYVLLFGKGGFNL